MARLTGRGSRVAGRGSCIVCRKCGFDVTDAGRKSRVRVSMSRVENYLMKFRLEFEVND